ncbi:VOC family protein [Microtetraspora glauca]|uniref:VOC family protein n=1 Tax=Microtetraspora glauca TaxID=1996 RepID=A0ABV3GMK8_MICGL
MIEIHTMTVDSARPYELAQWWSEALGWPLVDSEPGDDEVMLDRPDGPPHVLFIQVPEDKTIKNRLHFDVTGTDGATRDQEVERLVALGAKPYEDHRNPDGTGWVTLLDPEGNEFCVCRSEAERNA